MINESMAATAGAPAIATHEPGGQLSAGASSTTSPRFSGKPPSEEEMAYALKALPPAPPLSAATEAPSKPRKIVRFIESEREKTVVLQHPLECDDVVYDRITVRRMTMMDIIAHFDVPQSERGRWPCFFDSRGDAVPEEVLDALSLEDSQEVKEALQYFLPADLRAEPAPSSPPTDGAASPPS